MRTLHRLPGTSPFQVGEIEKEHQKQPRETPPPPVPRAQTFPPPNPMPQVGIGQERLAHQPQLPSRVQLPLRVGFAQPRTSPTFWVLMGNQREMNGKPLAVSHLETRKKAWTPREIRGKRENRGKPTAIGKMNTNYFGAATLAQ